MAVDDYELGVAALHAAGDADAHRRDPAFLESFGEGVRQPLEMLAVTVAEMAAAVERLLSDD